MDSRYRSAVAGNRAQVDLENGKLKHRSLDYRRFAVRRIGHMSFTQKIIGLATLLVVMITVYSVTRVQANVAETSSINKVSPSAATMQADRLELEKALESVPKPPPKKVVEKAASEEFKSVNDDIIPQRESMKDIMKRMMEKQNKQSGGVGSRQPIPQHLVAPVVENAIKSCMNMNPIMAANEVSRLVSWLKPTDIMLEYGSASSSCVWSHFVSKLYSIDHDEAYVNQVKMYARPNHQLVAVPLMGEKEEGKPSSMSVFEHYVKLPNKLNMKFDVVLLDGRAKPQAALNAIPLLNEDGVVILHNFRREHYFIIEEWYDVVDTHFSLAVLTPKKQYKGVGVTNPKLPEWW